MDRRCDGLSGSKHPHEQPSSVGVVLLVAVVVVLGGVLFVAANGIAMEGRDTNERPIPISQNLLYNEGLEKGTAGVWEDGVDTGLEADAHILKAEPHYGAYWFCCEQSTRSKRCRLRVRSREQLLCDQGSNQLEVIRLLREDEFSTLTAQANWELR